VYGASRKKRQSSTIDGTRGLRQILQWVLEERVLTMNVDGQMVDDMV
jgi:hypothetical protein